MIRDRANRVSETVQSVPVDLDLVAARLQEISTDNDRSTYRSPSPPRTATEEIDEEEQYRHNIQQQTENYNELVKHGGRPSHPLSRLEDIVKDPGEYREILSFWQDGRDDRWMVFGAQSRRWYDFRRLQRFARGQSAYDYWRSDWERSRNARLSLSVRIPVRGYCGAQDFMNTEDGWEYDWQQLKERYGDRRVVEVWDQNVPQYRPWEQFVKRQGHTTEHQGFPEYLEALKERLEKHGFTRIFQLAKDLDQQDKLTTWIEYLGYEYWWYDQHADFYKSRQRLHDEAWKKLVDFKVLRPEETEEVLCNIKSSYQRASERERAERAAQSAMSAVLSVKEAISKSQRCRISPQELQKRLAKAQSILDAATERHESIKTRNGLITKFIRRTNPYRTTKEAAERQSILLRWILQQVPLVELESNPPNEARNGSDRRGGRRMFKRDRPDELDEEQRSVDQWRDEGDRRSSSDQRTHMVSTSQGGERHSHNVIDDDRPSKRPKNSGRSLSLHTHTISDTSDLTISAGVSGISKTTARTSKARKVKRSNASPNQSSRVSKPLPRRSSRIAEREHLLKIAITTAKPPTPPSSKPLKRSSARTASRGRPKNEWSSSRKLSSSDPRTSALSKKPTTVKGTKPQGISRSRQAGTSRSKRSAKWLRD